jgi:glycosyltransferase involved in cell wall biosynthesis
MYKIFNFIGSDDSSSYYRQYLPTIHCREELLKHNIHVHLSPDVREGIKEDYDCYVFSRIPTDKSYVVIHSLYANGKKIIWDIDDEIWNIPEWNASCIEYDEFKIHFLGLYLSMASWITVSNDNLKQSLINKFSFTKDKISILENLIDVNAYKKYNISKDESDRPIKIMWSGSDSHSQDVKIMEHIYDYFKDNNDLIFILHGYLPEYYKDEHHDKFIFVPWHHRKYYEGIISLLSPDIALLPLVKDQFNSCKSSIKYYEMVMAGAACVASFVQPYIDVIKHRETGFTEKDPVNFIRRCEELIANFEERLHMNEQSRNDIYYNYSWNHENPRNREWLEFLKRIPDIPR